jgi:hypothetical protein
MLTVKNSTQHELSVFFDGPIARRITLPAGASQDVDLMPGSFRVAARVNRASDSDVVDILTFYGEQAYQSSAVYTLAFSASR